MDLPHPFLPLPAAVAALAALSLAGSAGADPPVHLLTLPDAVSLAQAHNPDFRSTEYDVAAAQGVVVQASVLPNPYVDLASYGTVLKAPGVQAPTQLGIGWTIPIGGKISAATQSAQAALEAARATRIAARRQLIITTEMAFTALQLALTQLTFARGDREGFHKELDLNELRYKDGKIAFGDLLKLRIQASSTDDEVREAEEAVESARADLRHVIGEDVLDADFEVVGELATPAAPTTGEIEVLLQQALQRRPDYLALLHLEKSAEASLLLARRVPIPDVSVLADYNRPQPGDPTAGNYDVILSIPIPVFDQNRGNIAQAEAAFQKAKLAEISLRTQIRSDLWKALQEGRAAHGLLAAYQGGVVAEAKESLEITRHSFDLGTSTLLDFLDAEASYRQVESAYRASLARAVLAALNIRFTLGEEEP